MFSKILGPFEKKNFHGPKLWVTASLNPEFQNHNDTSAYLRSHFGLNFNWTQHFFQGFFCTNFAWMWSVWCITYIFLQKWGSHGQNLKSYLRWWFGPNFWYLQKLEFLAHPNLKIGKNGNAPIHRGGFHLFFQKIITLI